jgi:hypothetical protein
MEKKELIEKHPVACEEIQAAAYMRGFVIGLREGRALARDLHEDRPVRQLKPALLCCFDDFVAACLILDAAGRCGAMAAYENFAAWYRVAVNSHVPTITMFGRRMGMRFKRSKSTGRNVYHGFRLRDDHNPGASEVDPDSAQKS